MSSFRQLMMRNKGGAKTLNLVSVGGATYDSDYIFTNDGSNKYFETKDEIELLKQSNDFTFIIKFQYTKGSNGIYRRENSYDFSGYINSINNFWGIVNGNYEQLTNIKSIDTWYWIKIERYGSPKFFYFLYSTDGINYTEYYRGYSAVNITTPKKILFGTGTSTGTDYSFKGKIDFKETDIIINGQSVLWV